MAKMIAEATRRESDARIEMQSRVSARALHRSLAIARVASQRRMHSELHRNTRRIGLLLP